MSATLRASVAPLPVGSVIVIVTEVVSPAVTQDCSGGTVLLILTQPGSVPSATVSVSSSESSSGRARMPIVPVRSPLLMRISACGVRCLLKYMFGFVSRFGWASQSPSSAMPVVTVSGRRRSLSPSHGASSVAVTFADLPSSTGFGVAESETPKGPRRLTSIS